jgi:glycerol-3-phosphate acyltransferase PlsY
MMAGAVLILGAYLLGSVPHLSFLARLRNVPLDGDFHQNLWNRAGKLCGIIGILGEFAKGVIPVLVGNGLGFPVITVALAGLAAVVGQMWPVFSKFDGEKRNSIALAMVIALAPEPAMVALVPVIIAVIIRVLTRLTSRSASPDERAVIGGAYSRTLPVGMAICFLVLPLAGLYFNEPAEIVLCFTVLFLLIMVRRLTAGIKRDLATGKGFASIFYNRLLLDRAAVGWRQPVP